MKTLILSLIAVVFAASMSVAAEPEATETNAAAAEQTVQAPVKEKKAKKAHKKSHKKAKKETKEEAAPAAN